VAPPSPSDGCSEKREVEVPPPSGGLGSKLRGGFVSGSFKGVTIQQLAVFQFGNRHFFQPIII
jgi:hypothetical protein